MEYQIKMERYKITMERYLGDERCTAGHTHHHTKIELAHPDQPVETRLLRYFIADSLGCHKLHPGGSVFTGSKTMFLYVSKCGQGY